MNTTKYTVTFKMVDTGSPWRDPKTGETGESVAGHLWYSLQINDEKAESFGFQSENGNIWDAGKVTDGDDAFYYEVDGAITIQINESQYTTLKAFGKQEGDFGFDYDNYEGLSNSCINFVFKALHLIGYNPADKDFFHSTPYYHFKDLYILLAKNNAIAIRDNTLIPVSELTEIYANYHDTIIGYDNHNDIIFGGLGDDRLIGGSGDDILHGGYRRYTLDDLYGIGTSSGLPKELNLADDGNDILEGGDGYDIYYIGGKDTVIDSDGKGAIFFLDKDYNIRPEDSMDIITSTSTDNVNEPRRLFGWINSFNPSDNSAIFDGRDPDTGEIYIFEAKGIKLLDQYYAGGTSFSAELLVITEKTTGHQVTIKNFIHNGQMNIYLGDIYFDDGLWSVLEGYYIDGYNAMDGSRDIRIIDVSGYYDRNGQEHVDSIARGPDLGTSSENNAENSIGDSQITDTRIGNDTTNTSTGNDTVNAGNGDDILNGGLGSDTYIFSKGHGQDVINEKYEWAHRSDKDTIHFTDITNPQDLWFSRSDNNLIIKELSSLDMVTVNDWYAKSDYKIETIKLRDDSALGISQVEKLVSAMASFEQGYNGDITLAPQEEVEIYMDKLAVSSYWS